MARWDPDARQRLEEAAFALFVEKGYDETTVAEIATRAGLTERTFFRHFTDKREVLFGGAAVLEGIVVAAIADAPPGATPIDAVASALDVAAAVFEARRQVAPVRQQIIQANAELRERELIKLARLSAAMAEALRARGVGEPAASLSAEAGITVLKVAFERWIAGRTKPGLAALFQETLADLRSVTAG